MATSNPYSDSLLMDALRGSLSNAESFGRGFGVAPVGLLGDVNALAREYITPRLPANVQGLLQSMPSAPTTESILSAIPRMTAPRMESSGMEQIGAAANPRGPINLGRAVASLPSDVARAGQEFLMANQPARVISPSKLNLNKGIYKPELTMEEMLKVKDIPTVDRVKQSIDLVGEDQFKKMVDAQYKKYKPTDQDQEAMLVESVTLDILGKAQRSPYPQEQALKLAQERAALPVEQGGLGLPPNNTPEMRAQAMGFDLNENLYHGTEGDFPAFQKSPKFNTYATEDPEIADIYAMSERRSNNAGPNIIPLVARGKKLKVSDYDEANPENYSGGWFGNNIALRLGIPWQRNLTKRLPAYGYDRLEVNDMADLGGIQTQHMFPEPEVLRSRFAAFDPFRKDVATATAMGVALPDLLAAEYNQQPQSAGLLYPLP